MSLNPFQPVGDRARWRTLYDLLGDVPTDGILTYETMADALGLDVEKRHTIQLAMRRAAWEHEKNHKRAVEPVPNVGYRVVQAEEHLRLARSQQKRSTGALKRGRSKVVNVDFNQIDAESRRAFEVVAQAFAMQMEINRRTDVRQARLEQAMEKITVKTERSEEELEALKARIARLESEALPTPPET